MRPSTRKVTTPWALTLQGTGQPARETSTQTNWASKATARRTAGIALLAGKVPRRWRYNALQLVVGQAVYLLRKSNSKDRPDEVMNLEALVALVAENSAGSKEACQSCRKPSPSALSTRQKARRRPKLDTTKGCTSLSELEGWHKDPALGGGISMASQSRTQSGLASFASIDRA